MPISFILDFVMNTTCHITATYRYAISASLFTAVNAAFSFDKAALDIYRRCRVDIRAGVGFRRLLAMARLYVVITLGALSSPKLSVPLGPDDASFPVCRLLRPPIFTTTFFAYATASRYL